MRKSLGEKRREISEEQVAQITSLHGSFIDGPRVKILPNDFFAYRRITVDRPLRGCWEIDPTRWSDTPLEDGPFAKLTPEARDTLRDALNGTSVSTHDSEEDARAALKAALVPKLGRVGAPLLKALAAACFIRDPEAKPVLDTKGRPLTDPELRDTETLAWTEDVAEYLSREVLPWAPDAFVADPEGKKGYEIALTRLFHRLVIPRPSEEIKVEIREIEQEFRTAIAEVLNG